MTKFQGRARARVYAEMMVAGELAQAERGRPPLATRWSECRGEHLLTAP